MKGRGDGGRGERMGKWYREKIPGEGYSGKYMERESEWGVGKGMRKIFDF